MQNVNKLTINVNIPRFFSSAITVGLTETLIVTNETVGVRQVCARVIDGNLERNAVVTLNLNPDTATGKH